MNIFKRRTLEKQLYEKLGALDPVTDYDAYDKTLEAIHRVEKRHADPAPYIAAAITAIGTITVAVITNNAKQDICHELLAFEDKGGFLTTSVGRSFTKNL